MESIEAIENFLELKILLASKSAPVFLAGYKACTEVLVGSKSVLMVLTGFKAHNESPLSLSPVLESDW